MQKRSKNIGDFYRHNPRTGDWSINFLNRQGLPIDEINLFFSKFGVVKKVRLTGEGSTGYCFVYFDSEDIARNCAKSMNNETSIRLRSFQNDDQRNELPKRQPETQIGTSQLQDDELDFSFKKREKPQDSGNPEETAASTNLELTEKPSMSDPNPPAIPENLQKVNEDSDSPSQSSKRLKNPTFPLRKPHPSTIARSAVNPGTKELWTTRYQRKLKSQSLDDSDLTQFESILNGPPALKNMSKVTEEIPGLIQARMLGFIEPEDDDVIDQSVQSCSELMEEIPDLIDASEIEFSSSVDDILSDFVDPGYDDVIVAEEVVVANIPEFCGVNLILELFRKYRPISASEITICADSLIRYCVIYFGTVMDAQAVESLYDDIEIDGKKLIVMRVDRIVDVAAGIHQTR